ncbi:MAG: anthranilate synthase component I [Verrucomicrobiia bacterium]
MNLPIYPDVTAFCQLAKQGNLVPVSVELLADLETPVSAYLKLAGQGDRFLLESVEQGERFARYSFVGFNPRAILQAKNGKMVLKDQGKKTQEWVTSSDHLRELEQWMARYRLAQTPSHLPLFFGGAVGFLSYEMIRYFEKTVPMAKQDDLSVPDLYFILSDTLLIFDHVTRRLKIVVNASVEEDDKPEMVYRNVCEKLQEIVQCLKRPLLPTLFFPNLSFDDISFQTNMTRDYYLKMAEAMKGYIEQGDIFQVVPSQRFEFSYTGSAIDLYRALRSINPSPYMFCLEFSDFALVGSSPEIHVRCEQNKVTVRPIAGTRPRRENPVEDKAMESELLADEKERAEHVMLVDLARNDVGRVCEFNTVKVSEFMTVERYSHVMHLSSHVEGELHSEKNMFDVMRATFPAGTVSGSPKVRAMQIIAELEPTQRATYAGAVGYFSFSGNLDSCIAIRTLLLKQGKAYLQAGGGLVADSTPEGEYQESVSKAKAGMKALALASAHQKMR